MSEHSPGPWSFGSHCIEDVNGKRVVDIDGGPPMTIDNARLIAAAPDLFNALKHCLGLLCESGNLNNYRNLSDSELGKAWTETAKEAATALNKAAPVALFASHQDREGS